MLALGNVVPKSHILAPSSLIPRNGASKSVGGVPQSCVLISDGVVSQWSRLATNVTAVLQTNNTVIDNNIARQIAVGSDVSQANESVFESNNLTACGSEVDDSAVTYGVGKKSTRTPVNYQIECKNKRRSIRRLKAQVSTLKNEIKRLKKV